MEQDSQRDRPVEIEITPEMISAGVSALEESVGHLFDWRTEPSEKLLEQTVRRVLDQMLAARSS
jgi:hypothetical protein